MAAGSTYTPIATTTLGSAAASYTFSSIPSTYTDLILVANTIMTAADYISIQVGNGSVDTGSNYSQTGIYGNGTTATSNRGSNQTTADVGYASTSVCNHIVHFQNYSNTSTNKTFLSRSNNTSIQTTAGVNLWRSTSAINTIKVLTYGGQTYAAGTTFTLYGIQAA